MAKPHQTKAGRPPVISAKEFIGARVPKALADKLDAWAKAKGIGRSEALRELIEKGLKNGASKK